MIIISLSYGMRGTLEHTNIGDDRRGVYAGVDEQGRYVILQKTMNGIKAYHAKNCIVHQWYNEDNAPCDELSFIMEGVEEVRELQGKEELLVRKILLQRLEL